MRTRNISLFSVVTSTLFFSACSDSSPGFEKIPQDRRGPVNIDSKNATFFATTPLLIVGGLTEKWRIVQTGKSVDVVLDQPFTISVITSGLLYREVYRFHKFGFYWNDNSSDAGHYSFTTIDGKQGTLLEPTAFFYNVKYGSFKNALHYPDGVVQTTSRVNVVRDALPNLLALPFQLHMKKIKKPGDSIAILSAFVYPWNNLQPPTGIYYSYPSSYTDEETGKVYYCVTTIILPLVPFDYISYEQFHDMFGSLVDASGKPLVNVAPQYPRGSRLVRKSQGVLFFLSLG